MKTSIKVSGANQLQHNMRNAADKVPVLARKRMQRGADRIVKLAKKFAPRLTKSLEDSIRKVASYGYRNRLSIVIEVGGGEIEEYVMQMHEGDYQLGPESQAKQAGQSEIVGPKFLERAVDAEAKHIEKYIKDAVERALYQALVTGRPISDTEGSDEN